MRAALVATLLTSAAAPLPAAAADPQTREQAPAAPESHTATRDRAPAADPHAATPESAAATPNLPAPTHEPPLIAYALELGQSDSRADDKAQYLATTDLRAITFEMSRHPPPSDAECANTLGASRFADQYARLATIQDQLGNFEAVIDANESALACAPRDASYAASIASALLTLGRIDEARAAIERGHAIDPEEDSVRDVRARLDFIQERWADATARFRLQALDGKGQSIYAREYARCYLWLAQRRAGVRNPEVPRPDQNEQELEPARQKTWKWPVAILDTLRGELTEEDLAQMIHEDGGREERGRLTEALFYIGELRLAEGDTETARRHFASVVNLKMVNFAEYGMARAELKKMRDRGAVADAATAGTQAR